MRGETNGNTPRRKIRIALRVGLIAVLVLGFIGAGATSAAATPDCDEDDDSTESATTPVSEECNEDDDSPRSVTTPEGDYDRSTGEDSGIDAAEVAGAVAEGVVEGAGGAAGTAADWARDPDQVDGGISKSEAYGMSHPTYRVASGGGGGGGGGSVPGVTTEQNERIRG